MTALRAVERIQKQIELQAKLLGELDERPQANVLVAPEWAAIRTALVEVFRPYPEARAAVAEHLLQLEGPQEWAIQADVLRPTSLRATSG